MNDDELIAPVQRLKGARQHRTRLALGPPAVIGEELLAPSTLERIELQLYVRVATQGNQSIANSHAVIVAKTVLFATNRRPSKINNLAVAKVGCKIRGLVEPSAHARQAV